VAAQRPDGGSKGKSLHHADGRISESVRLHFAVLLHRDVPPCVRRGPHPTEVWKAAAAAAGWGQSPLRCAAGACPNADQTKIEENQRKSKKHMPAVKKLKNIRRSP